MHKNIKTAFIILAGVFALLAVLAILSGAFSVLAEAEPVAFITGALFFIASIIVWMLAWAILIKGGRTFEKIKIGFACVFASMTPVQLGADAMRSLKMKDVFSTPYKETIAASMIVKGLKFLVIALAASASFFFAIMHPALQLWIKVILVSGFAVVILASLLFLLPLKKGIGFKIARVFDRLSKRFHFLSKVSEYFRHYSLYLKTIPAKTLALIAFLAIVSLVFEFVAFALCFFAANSPIPFYPMLILFTILAILERVPFLPKGIGIVEVFGILFLSMKSIIIVSLSIQQIVAVIILFDLMRLVIPTFLSMIAYFFVFKGKTNRTN